jgi:hypothetical protein
MNLKSTLDAMASPGESTVAQATLADSADAGTLFVGYVAAAEDAERVLALDTGRRLGRRRGRI